MLKIRSSYNLLNLKALSLMQSEILRTTSITFTKQLLITVPQKVKETYVST